MAKLLKKKHLINSSGEEELLDIYTTKVEATQSRLPCKSILVDIDGQMTTCYIGLTDELDTPKCSSKRVQIDDKTYAERKYMGMVNFRNYMKNTYPDTYQTMTELPQDFPDDLSDNTDMFACFYQCYALANINKKLDTRNVKNFNYSFAECRNLKEHQNLDTSNGESFSQMYNSNISIVDFPLIDTSKGKIFDYMYRYCKAANYPLINTQNGTIFKFMYADSNGETYPKLDTRNGENFNDMYRQCSSAIQVSDIDLSKAQDNNLTGVVLTNMLNGCDSLSSITFNNVPQGVTEEQLRTATSAPSTCEIILDSVKGSTPEEYYDNRITRIIQTQDGKLVEYDKDGSYPIKREGNKSLNEYIVAQGDWGTIYSDGVVTVEQLAPTTNSNYQIALSQLEEIQASGINLLNDEGYTPFNFKSLSDHKTLINDINNANIKEINNTKYPIIYQDSITGEAITVDKPVLIEGSIPIPISFGCLVTNENKIYTGLGYENYGKTVINYELENPILVSQENGISKYKTKGTSLGGGLCKIAQRTSETPFDGYETLYARIRLTYKGSYIPFSCWTISSNAESNKINITEDGNGWYILKGYVKWSTSETQKIRALAIASTDLKNVKINEDELFIEIDDDLFMYIPNQFDLPIIPQGMIVPKCNLEFTVPVDLVQNSIIVKDMEHMDAAALTSTWTWQSQGRMMITQKSVKSSLYSNSFREITGTLLENSSYPNNFKFANTAAVDRNIKTWKQLLIYSGDLTQEELETEKDKIKLTL